MIGSQYAFKTAHQFHLKRALPGGTAIAAILCMVAMLVGQPSNWAVGAVALLCLALFWLNEHSRLSDHNVNLVFLYLPLVFFCIHRYGVTLLLIEAASLYGYAGYVVFVAKPKVNKAPYGLSLMVFMMSLVDRADHNSLLVGLLILVGVLVFARYSFKHATQRASSLRHFLFEGIIMGLLLALAVIFDRAGIDALSIWGAVVMLYQSIGIAHVRAQSAQDNERQAWLGARLAWFQIGAFAALVEIVSDWANEFFSGGDTAITVALLIGLAFVPVYRMAQSPFLALMTRIWIGLLMKTAMEDCWDLYRQDYIERALDQAMQVSHLYARLPGDVGYMFFVFFIGVSATLQAPAARVPWWHGLIWARHMVLIRQLWRILIQNAKSIAFVGGIVSAISAFLKWILYAGGSQNRSLSRELMLLGSFSYGVLMTIFFGRYLQHCCGDELAASLDTSLAVFGHGELSYVVAWSFWGLLFYGFGVAFKDRLARFFAMAFVLMPVTFFAGNHDLDDKVMLAQVALICGLSFFSFGLLRPRNADRI